MPVFKIQHITKYEYDAPVRESVNEIRIMPYQSDGQEILQQQLTITGNPSLHAFTDYWENHVATFNLLSPHQELSINSSLTVRTINDPDVKVNYTSGYADLEKEIKGRLRMLELAKPESIEGHRKIKDIIRQ
jgi:transglutaminase-like putative cysteine protease